jgi:hypothetical protein
MTVEKNMRFFLDTRLPNLLGRRHHLRRSHHNPDDQQLTCDMNRAKVIIKDNFKLLDLLEEVKVMPSVKDVRWCQIAEVVGRKKSVPGGVMDSIYDKET